MQEENDKIIIRRQLETIEKLRGMVMEYDTRLNSLKNDYIIVLRQNKVLEAIIETLRREREKLLEEAKEENENNTQKTKSS